MGNRITKAVFHKEGGARNGKITYTHYVRDASGNTMAVYKRQQTATNEGTLTDHLTLNEQHLYGSSRLGLRSLDNTLNNSTFERLNDLNSFDEYQVGAIQNTTIGGWSRYRTNRPLGAKNYELSNHLGNVLATVSDRKLWEGATRIADVKSASDYYPFGMAIGDRTMSLAGYRYGFNGKEKDPSGEWGSQAIYDYGFRIYNPGLGKFLSVDPLTGSYPWYTPYQFAGNDVIRCVDVDGLERALVINTYSSDGIMRTNIAQVTDNGIAVNLGAVGNGIMGTLTLRDVLIINQGQLPGGVSSFEVRSEFNTHETAILNAGTDVVRTINAEITVQQDERGILSQQNLSDGLGDTGGFAFPGAIPTTDGQDFQLSGSIGSATMVNNSTERIEEVTEKIMVPISSKNFVRDFNPAITINGIAGGNTGIGTPWLNESQFNNKLIKTIQTQIDNGAIIDKIIIKRSANTTVQQSDGLTKWFNESFVPAASKSIGLSPNSFSFSTEDTKGHNFIMKIKGKKPSTKKSQVTKTETKTEKVWNY